MSKERKMEIMKAFLEQVAVICINAIEDGTEEDDPILQIVAACSYLEEEFDNDNKERLVNKFKPD